MENTIEGYKKKEIDQLLAVITKEQLKKITPIMEKALNPAIFMSLLEVYKDAIENMYSSVEKEIANVILEDFIVFLQDLKNPESDEDE